MTDYHPVTREELETFVFSDIPPREKEEIFKKILLRSQSTNVSKTKRYLRITPDEMYMLRNSWNWGDITINDLMNRILSRPDPLALLEAWRKGKHHWWWNLESDMIQRIRTNPEAVREQGVREGWWK